MSVFGKRGGFFFRTGLVFPALFLISVFFLVAPALAQDLPGLGSKIDAPATRAPVAVTPAVEDAQIAERLENIMKSTGWFANPQVTTEDGIVFLDGRTETQEHRRWAQNLAENTEGVIAVVNRIELDSDIGTTFDRAADETLALIRSAIQAWPLILLAIVIIFVSWLVARLVAFVARAILAHSIASPLLLSVLVRLISIPVFLLGIYLVLQVAGLTGLALTLLGGTGIAGIIIGFAFRDIAENFLASLLLSMRNPFRRGDLIDVNGYEGVVQNLNTRSTVLLTLDGNHIQIPNAVVFKSTIKNYSSIPSRRAEFTVGIGYDSSAGKAQSLIAEVLKKHPAVLGDPEPLVLVDQLGDATVNLRVQYWFDSASYSPAKINSALLRLTKNALLNGGIELPDPAREVVFPQGVPVIDYKENKPSSGKTTPKPAAKIREEVTTAVTPEEGDLSNESADLDPNAKPEVPEAGENLLK